MCCHKEHHLLSSPSDLAIGMLITITWIPHPRITDINLDSHVYCGNPIWLSTTSTQVKFWSGVHIDQGLKVSNGLYIGSSNMLSPDMIRTTMTNTQNGNISTQGTISSTGNFNSSLYIYI